MLPTWKPTPSSDTNGNPTAQLPKSSKALSTRSWREGNEVVHQLSESRKLSITAIKNGINTNDTIAARTQTTDRSNNKFKLLG